MPSRSEGGKRMGLALFDIIPFDSDGGFDTTGARAVLDGYDNVRPIEPAERAAWSACARAAGVRFWMSRLKDQYFPRPGHLTHTKDPTPFKKVCMVARE